MMKLLTFFFLLVLNFDLSSQASLVYGPYLQQGGPNSMLVSWRTSIATDSKLTWGTSSVSLSNTLTNVGPVTNHTIFISGLTQNTKYYYTVTNAAGTFTCNTFYFYTAPLPHSNRKLRFVATGDCGTALATQTNVRNALMNYVNGNYINGWLLLGDNAYNNGTDGEYTSKFFAPYQTGFLMQNTSLFPAPGNHDYANNLTLAENKSVNYYSIFDSPTTGQLGGVASNSEAYYSYNYGNVHFISLDSYGTETSLALYDTTGSVQYQWLKQDLNANTSMWTVVYFHHPPYTMGSHNSDSELDLAAIRQKLTPLFEAKNVDVVLNGHSHNLERSWLIKGHTGLEATFSKTLHATDTSSARYDGTLNSCPYIKDTVGNKGVVYCVCGSSGWFTFTQSTYPHNAMYYSNTLQGMATYMEVDSNRMQVRFIGEDSLVHDQFTIFKNVNKAISLSIPSTQTVSISASWNGNYNWINNGATTKQNLVTGISNTIILVKDSLNCIADTFKINVITLGLNKYGKKEFKIFPNPVTGNYLSVQLEQGTKVRSAALISVQGQTYNAFYSVNEDALLELKIPDIESGSYMLNITTTEGFINQKLIVERK